MNPNNLKIKFWLALLLVSIVSIFIAGTAFAVYRTINTNNAQIDSAWGDPLFTGACNETIDDRDEIKYAWVANDADKIYFRIQACDAGTILSSAAVMASGGIDCNMDGDIEDPWMNPDEASGDRSISYDSDGPYGEVVWYSTWEGTSVFPLGYLSSTNGERIGNQIEWQWPMNQTGFALPPDCKDQVNIGWATVNDTTYAKIDETSSLVAYNVPTNVALHQLRTRRLDLKALRLAGVVGLGVLGLTSSIVFFWYRKIKLDKI